MLKTFGQFLVVIDPLLNIVTWSMVLIPPIFLIVLYRHKWLAILVVGLNFVVVAYIETFLNCLQHPELCNAEDYEIGPFINGFIFGIIYGLLVLAVVSLIRILIDRKSRRRG
jgi:hypothetical protein